MNNELIVIEKSSSLKIFTTKDGLNPFIQKIKDQVNSFVPDITTEKGRKEVKSIAYSISRSKTYLSGIGKELLKELEEKPNLVKQEIKRTNLILDELRDQVREQVTKLEKKEKERIAHHRSQFPKIRELRELYNDGMLPDQIKMLINRLTEIKIDETWDEFESSAKQLHSDIKDFLETKLIQRIAFEKEEIERIEKLKIQKEKDEKEKEERIKKEAVEQERKRKQEQELKEMRDREEREKKEKDASLKRENDLKLQKERAVKEKQEAIEREELAKIENEKRIKLAQEKERQKIQAENDKIEKEKLQREANLIHVKNINNEALRYFVLNNIDKEIAIKVITLIARNEIPHIEINY